VVSSPSHHRLQDDTLIAERAVGVVGNGVAEIMAVAGGIREIVFAVILVHPAGLKETVRVASLHGLALVVGRSTKIDKSILVAILS